jgi:hypothetical protein
MTDIGNVAGEHKQPASDIASLMARIEQSLPQHLAAVTHSNSPKGLPRGLVVCISDLHSHIPVQRNIAEIIGHLGYNYRFRLLCVEGASGEGDTSLLWSLPMRIRLDFCNSLFDKGYLTGAEFAVTTRPQLGLVLWGVDVPSLYRVQWRAFKHNLQTRPSFVVPLLDSHRRMRRLYSALVSRDLLRLMRLRYPGQEEEWNYRRDDEVEALIEIAERKNIMLPANLWAKVAKWRKADAERRVAHQALLGEMQAWVDTQFLPVAHALAQCGPDLKQDFVIASQMDFAYEQLDPLAQRLAKVSFSVDALLRKVPVTARTRVSDAYTRFCDRLATMPDRYRGVYQAQKSPSLWWTLSGEDRDRLWDFVAHATCTTEADNIVLNLEQTYSKALKFLTLSMQASESLAFITPAKQVDRFGHERTVPARDAVCSEIDRDITRLNDIGAAVGRGPMPRDLVIALQAFWDSSETYYSVARRRSTGMAKNVAAAVAARRLDRGIAISGGYHSQDMSDWLTREAGLSTMIITPSLPDSTSAMKAAEYRYNRRGLEEE